MHRSSVLGRTPAASGRIATNGILPPVAPVPAVHTVAVLALPDTIAFDLATPVEMFGRRRLPGVPATGCWSAVPNRSSTPAPLRLATDQASRARRRGHDRRARPQRRHPAARRPRAWTRSRRVRRGHPDRVDLLGRVHPRRGWAPRRAAGHHPLGRRRLVPSDVPGRGGRSRGALRRQRPGAHLGRRVGRRGPVPAHGRPDYGAAVAADAARLAVAPLHRSGGQAQFILRNTAHR